MAEHPIKSVYQDGAAPAKSSIRSHFMARVPLVLVSASEIQTTNVDGTTVVIVGATGQVYRYDSTDTTTPHDGIIVLVDSAGKRFKNASVYAPRSGVYTDVISMTETAPPVSPNDGDIYIVGVGATDAWATHDNKIAIYAGAWFFEIPQTGALAWVNDLGGYARFTGSAWSSGLTGILADNSVKLRHMLQGPNLRITSTANSPAGGESDGAAYIVGSSPTGAFSGFTPTRIAIKEGGSWVQYTQATGWVIDDLSASTQKRWNGSAWVAALNTPSEVAYWGAWTDFVTLGTASGPHTIRSFNAAVQAAGHKILFTIMVSHTGRTDSNSSLRLYRDAEGSPFYLRVFGAAVAAYPRAFTDFVQTTVSDTDSHTYKLEVEKAANSVSTDFYVSWRATELV